MESKDRVAGAVRVTVVGSVVNVLLSAVKLIAGVFGHSQAMLADGIHSLSDVATDVVVIYGVAAGSKPRDRDHAYGHGKFETLATTIIGVALLAVGIGIFYSAAHEIWQFFHGAKIPTPTLFPLIMALVSVVSKEALARYTISSARKLGSSAMKANAWHHRSDALSSIGAGLGIAGAMYLGPGLRVLDPIAGIVVSALVVKVGFGVTRKGVRELAEASLDPAVETRILEIVSSVGGAVEPHNLRTRQIGNAIAVDLHIRVNPELTVAAGHAIATEVETRVRKEFGGESHVSVHVEPYKETARPAPLQQSRKRRRRGEDSGGR